MRSLLGLSVVYLLTASASAQWWLQFLVPGSPEVLGPANFCSCGPTGGSKRIVNGKAVLPNIYPFMMSLIRSSTREPFCGASILTTNVALTAAHCTHGNHFAMSVIAGAHDLRFTNPNAQEARVSKVIEHEEYVQSSQGVYNDIALLVLQNPLRFTAHVAPACLPVSQLNLENQAAKIIGWGKTGFNQPISPILMEIDVRIQTARQCNAFYPMYQDSTMICSGNPKVTACMGDSGGPVLWVDPQTNRHTLVGLVSYGKDGCIASIPTVQTDVSAFLPWIQALVPGYCHRG